MASSGDQVSDAAILLNFKLRHHRKFFSLDEILYHPNTGVIAFFASTVFGTSRLVLKGLGFPRTVKFWPALFVLEGAYAFAVIIEPGSIWSSIVGVIVPSPFIVWSRGIDSTGHWVVLGVLLIFALSAPALADAWDVWGTKDREAGEDAIDMVEQNIEPPL